MRIVSLLPSATEIVCALGLSDALVGISHDCDYPAEVLDLPVLSAALLDPSQPSPAIDAAVRDRVHRGTSVYHLDASGLDALRPDLILTQELCEVCAPSFTEVRRAARLFEDRTRLVSLEPMGLGDILETVTLVGDLTGARQAAGALFGELDVRIEAVRRLPSPEPRPRVLCVEWLDPIFVAGHWVPEMVEIAGGEDGLGRPRARSVTVPWEAVLAYAPEIVVLMPCGFDLERARGEAPLLTGRPGWETLPAVVAGRVYATDGSAYFNRPGPRVVRGLEILAALLRDPGGPLAVDGAAKLDTAR